MKLLTSSKQSGMSAMAASTSIPSSGDTSTSTALLGHGFCVLKGLRYLSLQFDGLQQLPSLDSLHNYVL